MTEAELRKLAEEGRACELILGGQLQRCGAAARGARVRPDQLARRDRGCVARGERAPPGSRRARGAPRGAAATCARVQGSLGSSPGEESDCELDPIAVGVGGRRSRSSRRRCGGDRRGSRSRRSGAGRSTRRRPARSRARRRCGPSRAAARSPAGRSATAGICISSSRAPPRGRGSRSGTRSTGSRTGSPATPPKYRS